jgi:hypothetical protein
MKTAYSIPQIRTLLEARFGAKNFRITRTGAIHVYAIAPNTGRVMWWFWGYVGAADTELRLDELAAEYGEEGRHDRAR